jgi:hypothetical protein
VAVSKNVDPKGEDVVQENFLVAVEDLEGFAHTRAIHHARRKDAVRLCAKIKCFIFITRISFLYAWSARAHGEYGSSPFVTAACATKEIYNSFLEACFYFCTLPGPWEG